MEAFARRRRHSGLLVAAGVLLGGGIVWLGDWADSMVLLLLGGVLLVVPVLIGAAGLGTCPVCGGGFSIPEGESGSWNYCFSCGARLR